VVTFADLRDADTSALYTAGQAWWRYAEALRALEERMNDDAAGGLLRAGWDGDAADTAVERSEAIEGYFDLRSFAADLVAGVYDSAYDQLWQLKWRLTAAIDQAAAEGLSVRTDGVVEPPSRRAQELTDEIAGIVGEAGAVDQQTADALALLGPDAGQVGTAGWTELSEDAGGLANLYGLREDSVPTDPAAAAAWWGRLSNAQQALYLAAFPAVIGARNGLPVVVRDRANRLALSRHGVPEQSLLDRLAPSLAPLLGPLAAAGSWMVSRNQRRLRPQTLLDRLEASEHRPDHQRLYLLGFNLDDDGRAVIAIGDPDTADHTAVYVPGMSTTIDTIGGDLDRMQNLQQEADRLTFGRTGDVATVMWLGYDTPGADLSVARSHHARAGAPELDSFIDGLRAARHEPGHVTVIGHSYGSTVIGTAASDGNGLAVDDIAVAGSPGMRVDNVDALQIDPRHVWAGDAEDDHVSGPIGWFAHGAEPHEEGFGANRFVVDTEGHSDYWKRDTDSLENQAAIVVGHYGAVHLEHGEAPS